MIVGVLTVDLAIFDAQSLKDKRRVVSSLKQRIQSRFNVSVAEVEFANMPKQCRLGVAMIATESRALHSQLDKLVDCVREARGLSLITYSREIF